MCLEILEGNHLLGGWTTDTFWASKTGDQIKKNLVARSSPSFPFIHWNFAVLKHATEQLLNVKHLTDIFQEQNDWFRASEGEPRQS